MRGEDAFQVEGRIIQVLTARTARVQLENGHELLGYLLGRSAEGVRLVVDERVRVQLSPYDLSEARISAK
jgi:translation initiation factor IF-1